MQKSADIDGTKRDAIQTFAGGQETNQARTVEGRSQSNVHDEVSVAA